MAFPHYRRKHDKITVMYGLITVNGVAVPGYDHIRQRQHICAFLHVMADRRPGNIRELMDFPVLLWLERIFDKNNSNHVLPPTYT